MTQVLVDTSVWRRHFSGKLSHEQALWFGGLLDEDGVVLTHPWVIGELVLGGISSKEERLLRLMPSVAEVTDSDLFGFIRHRRLAQRGIGWVDVHLVACALTHSARLWTLDKNLESVVAELEIRFEGLE